MDIFIYCIIGIIGILFGSFFTLATYRLPKEENIVYKRSYCPHCGHKLAFWDLIPVFSYIFLGGKCRYCKEKIGVRYIAYELLSGLVFILIALIMNININSDIYTVAKYIYLVLTFSVLCIVMGTKSKVNLSVVLSGVLIRSLYLIYFEVANLRPYMLYMTIYLVIVLLEYIVIVRAKSYEDVDENIFNWLIFSGYLVYIFNHVVVFILLLVSTIVFVILTKLFKRDIDFIANMALFSILTLIVLAIEPVSEYIFTMQKLLIY